jgi:galactose mutarotase-like enzyme
LGQIFGNDVTRTLCTDPRPACATQQPSHAPVTQHAAVRVTYASLSGAVILFPMHRQRFEPVAMRHPWSTLVPRRSSTPQGSRARIAARAWILATAGIITPIFHARDTAMPTLPILRFQDQELVRVGNADRYLLLAPKAGGRLVRWVHEGEDVLYWPEVTDWSRPAKIRGGNPLLFPFIGRHFVNGVAGRWTLPQGGQLEMPQHGFARDLPFDIADVADAANGFDADAITMILRDSDATRTVFPFHFDFEVTYRLLGEGLEIALRVRHTGQPGAAPMPYYAGHHFYFALPHAVRPQATLALPPATMVRQGPDGSLASWGKGETSYALDDARLQDTFHVLQNPAGAPLAVTLDMPASAGTPGRRTLMIDLAAGGPDSLPWVAVTTWAEHADSDYYCVEPWLGLPDAIHHGKGLQWLEPGTEGVALCTLRLTR